MIDDPQQKQRQESGTDVLIVDDEESIRQGCAQALTKSGFRVETVRSGQECLDFVAARKAAVVLLDLKMAGISGQEVLERLRPICPETSVVIITGYATVESAVQALKTGAYDFLSKPFTPAQLRTVVERALERYRLAVEKRRLQQEQEDLLLVMYHDLKSPLATVKSYLLLLSQHEGDKLSDASRTRLNRAIERTDTQLGLIEDLCMLSKLDIAGPNVVSEPVEPADICRQVVESFAELAAEKNVTITCSLQKNLPAVAWNRDETERLLSNLVSNAVKYNEPGGKVTVVVTAEDCSVKIVVADTGIGMSPEEQKRLFDRFYRIRNEKTRYISGSGLGLSIVRKIVDARGGTLRVESALGKGSAFTVVLPIHKGGSSRGKEENSRDR
ncbi:MAG: hybrid sensor histidine kinase/response regulator [Planctomycetota bacterium]|nr:hybrid sensor histidine kinase/response regulator [Planctomycetota bacterium]